MIFKRIKKLTCDREQFPFAIRQGKFVICRVTFVIIKVKDAFYKMLLDNGRLAMQKSLSDVEEWQITKVFIVIARKLQDSEKESATNLQVIFLQQMNEQYKRLFFNRCWRVSQAGGNLLIGTIILFTFLRSCMIFYLRHNGINGSGITNNPIAQDTHDIVTNGFVWRCF